jgi:hypothetical protein
VGVSLLSGGLLKTLWDSTVNNLSLEEFFMKKTLLLVLAGMLFCAGIAFSQGIPVVGQWDAYNDNGPPDNGSSTITMTQVTMEGQPAYRFTGNVTTKFQYGFTGWMITPNAATLTALRAMRPTSTLSFKVQGDGQRYTVKLRSSRVRDYANHEFHFNTTAGQTQTVTVQVRQFMQPAWGASVGPLAPATIDDVSFQTHEVWRKVGEAVPYDITVWDLRITQ